MDHYETTSILDSPQTPYQKHILKCYKLNRLNHRKVKCLDIPENGSRIVRVQLMNDMTVQKHQMAQNACVSDAEIKGH